MHAQPVHYSDRACILFQPDWNFSLFIPPKNLKNQNFEKMKMCTKNHNNMMYGSWDMEWDRQNFFSFWANFWLFTPLATQKIKIWKNEQTIMSSFYTCVTKIIIICMLPEIWSVTDIIFCHFGPLFTLLTLFCPFKIWEKC